MPPHQKNNPNLEYLKSVLAYVPETGQFFYRITKGPRKSGTKAGSKTPTGYIIVTVDREPFLAHRLAISFQTGKWPEKNVDHINGIRDDNRLLNLREATQSLNIASAVIRRYGQGGSLGIRFKKGAWEASLKKDGKEFYLGRFQDKTSAQEAYLRAAKHYHGTEAFEKSDTISIPLVDGAQFFVPQIVPDLTREHLLKVILYDPETGVMTRKISKRGLPVGVPIGQRCWEGYLRAKVGRKSYLIHRLAWFYMTGEWPKGEIHHVNHNPSDNRWDNLRDISGLENIRLRRPYGKLSKSNTLDTDTNATT